MRIGEYFWTTLTTVSLVVIPLGGLNVSTYQERISYLENRVRISGSPQEAICHNQLANIIENDSTDNPIFDLLVTLGGIPGTLLAEKKFKDKYGLQSLGYPEDCK